MYIIFHLARVDLKVARPRCAQVAHFDRRAKCRHDAGRNAGSTAPHEVASNLKKMYEVAVLVTSLVSVEAGIEAGFVRAECFAGGDGRKGTLLRR